MNVIRFVNRLEKQDLIHEIKSKKNDELEDFLDKEIEAVIDAVKAGKKLKNKQQIEIYNLLKQTGIVK